LLKTILLIPILAWLLVSVVVDFDAPYNEEKLAFGSGKKAIILMHPSWIDHFQQDLTYSFATGLGESNWQVDRVTTQSTHRYDFSGYDLIVIGTNNHFLGPDLPTRRMLEKADFLGKPVVGIVSGIGGTANAETKLAQAIPAARGTVLDIHGYWSWRSNRPKTTTGSDRQDAVILAHDFGREIATKLH
jgi:hypothetical protein